MKVKLFLFKKLMKKEQKISLSELSLYVFIEKLFFLLSDLLYFYMICKFYKFNLLNFKNKFFKI